METEYIAYICEKFLTCFLITDVGLIYKTDLCWTGAHLIAKIKKKQKKSCLCTSRHSEASLTEPYKASLCYTEEVGQH